MGEDKLNLTITYTTPGGLCPVCMGLLSKHDTATDMSAHYWWHKLEELRAEVNQRKQIVTEAMELERKLFGTNNRRTNGEQKETPVQQ